MNRFDQPTAVAAVMDAYPDKARSAILALRKMVLETAEGMPEVGVLTETLKWGEPAYLTDTTKSGTTIRLAWSARSPDTIGLFVNCRTSLVEAWRDMCSGQLLVEGKRAIRICVGQKLPEGPLRHCIAMALTYHQRKPAS